MIIVYITIAILLWIIFCPIVQFIFWKDWNDFNKDNNW